MGPIDELHIAIPPVLLVGGGSFLQCMQVIVCADRMAGLMWA